MGQAKVNSLTLSLFWLEISHYLEKVLDYLKKLSDYPQKILIYYLSIIIIINSIKMWLTQLATFTAKRYLILEIIKHKACKSVL